MTQQNPPRDILGTGIPKIFTIDLHKIYDNLMVEIEPDLTTENVKKIGEKYKNEPEKEKKKRIERYKKALAVYETRKQEYFSSMDREVAVYCKQVLQVAEEKSKTKEDAHLLELESIFNN